MKLKDSIKVFADKDISLKENFLDNVSKSIYRNKLRDFFDDYFRRSFYGILYKGFFKKQKYKIDLILPSKGFSDEARKNKLNQFYKIKDKDILIIGCGNGQDILNLLKFRPKSIKGIDMLNYSQSWSRIKKYLKNKNIKTKISFQKIDILHLQDNLKFDFIISDAVFEHLVKFKKVIKFLTNILKKNGMIYASYGPLWYCYAGDHFSGRDKFQNGYNHLILNKKNYKNYFEKNVGTIAYEINRQGSAGILVKENLFSKLNSNEYMKIYNENNLVSLFTVLEYCPIGFKLLRSNKILQKKILKKNTSINLEDLYLKSHIVYLKKK